MLNHINIRLVSNQAVASLFLSILCFLYFCDIRILDPNFNKWLMPGDSETYWLNWLFYQESSIFQIPIFKNFIESAIFKEEMKPFKAPSDIYFFPVDYNTGKNASFSNRNAIIEAFKENNLEEIRSKNLNIGQNYDKFSKFRRFY